MYERIMEIAWDDKRNPIRWRVYSKDFREVVSDHSTFEAARTVIELEIRQARECPSCED